MELSIIDYSGHYYLEVARRPLPRKRGGKFIHVTGAGGEYLVFSPRELTPYHANIAERFFLSLGVEGSYNRKRDRFSVGEPGWKIKGGGVWEVDEEAGLLVLYGASMAYGGFNPGCVPDGLFLEGPFEGLRARVGASEMSFPNKPGP